ncbi:putative ribonuclease H protein [Cardamine amara subsp. amara]|uniref:Ribonuclease H protein n=1 Tax=Cardamine amara subsp. amara TaxID=228776 RepID=A0ABD1ASL4_CARAN
MEWLSFGVRFLCYQKLSTKRLTLFALLSYGTTILSLAQGARVSWSDICRPKSEGGLGIRKLEDFETVFRLKQVWDLFAKDGSLWYAWLHRYIFRRKSYLGNGGYTPLSWTIRKLLQIRPLFAQFIRCSIGDGKKASFWYDSWTEFGPLIVFLGSTGPRDLRIRKEAKVIDATRDGDWFFPGARSPSAEMLLLSLTNVPPPDSLRGSDSFLWRQPQGTFADSFSTTGTWDQIRVTSPQVPWASVVWFKEGVPRYSFIHWLALLDRLPTRDRLRSWGMNVPATCVLCSSYSETNSHLFFECEFARSIWLPLASKVLPNTPLLLSHTSSWILNNTPTSAPHAHGKKIIRLLLQSVIYATWRERNARIFTDTHTSAAAIKLSIDRTMRDRLLSYPTQDSRSVTLLQYYFGCMSLPL